MADNTKWLQRVVFKLNELHLNGFDFSDVHRWIFDWDDKLTSKENLENVSDEDRALTTLKQAGIISGISKDNFYREQQEWQLADKGFGMWSDWDTTDPAHREYDYMWFVDGFDYDRFMKFCETHGFNPNENPMPQEVIETTKSENKHIAKVFLVQQSLKISYKGTTFVFKRFDSKKRFNYHLAKCLLARPDEWVSKNNLGTKFNHIETKAKDWPKLMGFTGELRKIFINVNSKKQTIMLNPHKSLDQSEVAIFERLVNTAKPK